MSHAPTPDAPRHLPASWLLGREVVVPGSTANLGPGFDTLSLALDLTVRLRVADLSDDGAGRVTWRFGRLVVEGENALDHGYRAGLAAFAPDARAPLAAPSLVVDVESDLPLRAGLGSSAAALVAGLRLAELVAGPHPQPTALLLRLAAALEGHPDNTSASLLGGFVVSCQLPGGQVVAQATAWPPDWRLVVATPALALATKVARAALPASFPLADAVFNLQRTALLVEAVHRQDTALLRAALADRLHQPFRAALVPGLEEALTWQGEGLLGVFLSGAGPSIAALVDARVDGAAERAEARFAALYQRLRLDVTLRHLRAHALLPTCAAPDA